MCNSRAKRKTNKLKKKPIKCMLAKLDISL